jgi:hypothetical protein
MSWLHLNNSCNCAFDTQSAQSTARCLATCSALQGFQFNHVGGGTKTRRPITLHMKYNKDAVQPCCFLMTEDAGEQEVTLEELQVCACACQSLWPAAAHLKAASPAAARLRRRPANMQLISSNRSYAQPGLDSCRVKVAAK